MFVEFELVEFCWLETGGLIDNLPSLGGGAGAIRNDVILLRFGLPCSIGSKH